MLRLLVVRLPGQGTGNNLSGLAKHGPQVIFAAFLTEVVDIENAAVVSVHLPGV